MVLPFSYSLGTFIFLRIYQISAVVLFFFLIKSNGKYYLILQNLVRKGRLLLLLYCYETQFIHVYK